LNPIGEHRPPNPRESTSIQTQFHFYKKNKTQHPSSSAWCDKPLEPNPPVKKFPSQYVTDHDGRGRGGSRDSFSLPDFRHLIPCCLFHFHFFIVFPQFPAAFLSPNPPILLKLAAELHYRGDFPIPVNLGEKALE
jgi:hypothetical protein